MFNKIRMYIFIRATGTKKSIIIEASFPSFSYGPNNNRIDLKIKLQTPASKWSYDNAWHVEFYCGWNGKNLVVLLFKALSGIIHKMTVLKITN